MTSFPPRWAAPWLLAAVAWLLLSAGPAHAQSLAEVSLVAATTTELHPSVRLPRGSVRAVGPGLDGWIAQVPDRARWTAWEGYVARGLASRLRPAFVQQVATSFAAAGFFEVERGTREVGGATHRRIEFEDAAGERTLLYLIEGPEELLWLVAASR